MDEIVIAPAPVLGRVARDPLPAGAALTTMIDRLERAMLAARGIGIAAPQIGLGLPLALLAPPGLPQPLVLIAPKILEREGEQRLREGCLSLPAWTGIVTRPTRLLVRTARPDGSRIELVLRDELARIAEHEIDHLLGRLYMERAEPDSLQPSGR